MLSGKWAAILTLTNTFRVQVHSNGWLELYLHYTHINLNGIFPSFVNNNYMWKMRWHFCTLVFIFKKAFSAIQMFVYTQITSGDGSTSWSLPSRQWPNKTTRGDNLPPLTYCFQNVKLGHKHGKVLHKNE